MRYLLLIMIGLVASGFKTGDDETAVKERLSAIQNEVPLPYNRHVENYIEVYQRKKSSLTQRILAESEFYFPMIEEILESNGLPLELKYMAVIESALNPKAVSKMGATGMWQFMYSTAKLYQLKVGTYIDERSDPELSTQAASQYLKRMYDKYDDWLMVIASYNCGPGNVDKAIRKSGGKRDFWSIYQYLPAETRGYVPAFIAAMYVMEYADVLGLEADHSGTDYHSYTPVSFRKELLLPDLADKLEIDVELLRKANASLTGKIIPADYPLRLPPVKHEAFYESIDELYALAEERIESIKSEPKKKKTSPAPRVAPVGPDMEPILYTVKEGDILGIISYWYDAGIAQINSWNGLRNSVISVGQELIIYVPRDKATSYARYDKLSNRQKNILSSDRAERMLYAKRFDERYLYHEVMRGDTYSSIAALYDCVTIDEIKSLNQVGDRGLKPGMILKIMANA